ncbi:MAG TPA: hypothetical protein VNH18_10140 [Bryobacteraceae bacterium]|nr:hypothetical protein [Bryobacteraceae bacterium]
MQVPALLGVQAVPASDATVLPHRIGCPHTIQLCPAHRLAWQQVFYRAQAAGDQRQITADLPGFRFKFPFQVRAGQPKL